jgi:hypothetical protein
MKTAPEYGEREMMSMNQLPPEIDHQAEGHSARGLNRRDFLKIATIAAAGCMLSRTGLRPAFAQGPDSTPQPNQEKTPNPKTPEQSGTLTTELTGEQYTETIVNHDLVPVVPTEKTAPKDQIAAGMNYLIRLGEALKENPDKDPLISSFLNFGEHYPLAVPDDWKLSDVINTYRSELESGKTQVAYVESYPKLMGTRRDFTYNTTEKRWERKTIIMVGKSWVTASQFHEGEKYWYRYDTDAETAILLQHEFIHALQDEMLLQYVSSTLDGDEALRQKVGSDPEKFLEEVRKVEKEVTAALGQRHGEGINYREAQANTVHFMLLYCLNKLNNSDHFPGTIDLDPGNIQIGMVRKIDPQYVNLYQKFKDSVLSGNFPQGNSLNPEWLKYYNENGHEDFS